MRRALLAAAVLLVGGATPAAAQDTFVLTVKHVDRDGNLAQQHETAVVNKDTFERTPVGGEPIKLHAGQYALQTTIRGAGSTDFLSYPNLDMTRDVTLDLDARVAKPVVIKPPDPAAKLEYATIDVPYGGLSLRSLVGLSIAHLGPRTPDGLTLINTQWLGKDFYGLAWYHRDGLPNGFQRTPSRRDLAKVHVKFGASLPGKIGWRTATPASGPSNLDSRGGSPAMAVPLPSERTEFYNPETYWIPTLYQLKAGQEPPTPSDIEHRLFPEPRRYPAGTHHVSVNHAVTGPALPEAGFPTAGIERSADLLTVWIPMFSDGDGNAGWSTTDRASTVLHRDGVKIAENDLAGSGVFEIPQEDGTYRLEASASRTGVARLSSRVSVAWTFRSSAATTGLLPLSTIRFAPRLDGDTGRPGIVPVFLRDQRSEIDHVAKQLAVDVSFDEGATWKPARVVANAAAVVDHPPGTSMVSLRGKAIDRHGNTVEQTIINAYQTGRGNG